MMLREKSLDAKGIKKFREQVDCKLLPKYDARPTFKQLYCDMTKEETAYGKPSQTLQTPIKTIINGQLGNETQKKYENKALEFYTMVSLYLCFV